MSERNRREAESIQNRLDYTLRQLQNTKEQAEIVKDPQLHTLIKTAVDSTEAAKKYLDAKLGIG